MLGLIILLAGSLLGETYSRAEIGTRFPDPCEVQGQEFYGFVGGYEPAKGFHSNAKDFFFGPTGALAPIAGRNETWVVILPCPYVRGQASYLSLFLDENTAWESMPTLFARYLAMKNRQRKRIEYARGRGSYDPEFPGVSLREPLKGSIYSIVQISETAGNCFCRKEKG